MKAYPRIAAALYSSIWAIQPATFAAIRTTFERAVTGALLAPAAAAAAAPAALELPSAQPAPAPEANSVAIIPVHGIIAKHISQLEAQCGGIDLVNVERALRAARSDVRVRYIVLHFHSPGGTVTGVPEMAQLIAEIDAEKPVFAFTDSLCCSAAYWMAAACREIVVTPSAIVGSIGVYSALVDESAAWAKEGYKLELMKAGEHKAAGIPGLPLAPEDRALIQANVDRVYALFTADVRAGRGDVSDAVMQGQTFMGQEAVTAGLADGVVNSLTELLESLATMDGGKK